MTAQIKPFAIETHQPKTFTGSLKAANLDTPQESSVETFTLSVSSNPSQVRKSEPQKAQVNQHHYTNLSTQNTLATNINDPLVTDFGPNKRFAPAWIPLSLLGLLTIIAAGFMYGLNPFVDTPEVAPTPQVTQEPVLVTPAPTLSLGMFPLTISQPIRDEIDKLPWIWEKPAFENFFLPGVIERDVLTVNSEQEWLLHGGWCGTTTEILTENLSKFTVQFFIDGEQVSSSNILEYSLQQAGEECLMMVTKLSDWPDKSIIDVEARYELTADVDDGTDIYKAGVYRHLATISIDLDHASKLPQTIKPKSAKPSSDELQNVRWIWYEKLVFQNPLVPTTEKYVFSTNTNQEWLWSIAWCAISTPVLTENLAAVDFQLIIDDAQLPESDILRYSAQSNDKEECEVWVTKLSDWPADTTLRIEAQYELSRDVDDGKVESAAGLYRHVVDVTVD